jgi:hypothetical protein
LIAQLQKENSDLVHSHAGKEAILWEAFKDRLGHSDYTSMAFNLNYFLESNSELAWLEEPYTREEIDNVVRNLPNTRPLVQMALIMSLSRNAGIS